VTSTRRTGQREAIERTINDADGPLSPQEIHSRAVAVVASLSLATVYRTLQRLRDEGLVAPVAIPGQPDRWEAAEAASRHHHHFHCDRCDTVYDLDGCVAGVDQLAPSDFVVTGHELMLTGTCKRCLR
jgi:Fur family ferric uptake transcriptional regulator